MDLKRRKRWSLIILLIGMPLYIVVAVTVMNWLDHRFGRQPIVIEVGLYVVLGIIWIMPFRKVFSGIGKPE